MPLGLLGGSVGSSKSYSSLPITLQYPPMVLLDLSLSPCQMGSHAMCFVYSCWTLLAHGLGFIWVFNGLVQLADCAFPHALIDLPGSLFSIANHS